MRCLPRDSGRRMPRVAGLLGIALLTLASAVQAGATTAPPGRLPTDVTPTHYDIVVEPDAQALRFKGHETIDVVVHRETRSITLNALDLEVSDVALDGKDTAEVQVDADAQAATFTFRHPVTAGPHRLSLSFAGKIYTSAAGFFALDYESPAGPQRMLSMQLEPADGRRFVPMWDEPAAKATFTLEAVIPSNQVAYSNMPEASNRILADKRHVRFQPTPKMSSYLLHLTVGDLERISRTVAGVDIGIVTRRGAAEQGRFALDAAAEILPWYNDYFGTPYPLPKLDMIAGPGRSQFFGAMENWGAIFYFEGALLVDPRRSSEWDRQWVFDAVAHEVAHQWFGDLVTMEWWDGLWLNEGFATWMASKVTNALHPQRKPWLQAAAGGREYAMQLDAGSATHAVLQPVLSIDAVAQAFDAIAYNKGAAVIRMLEDMVGEDGFRAGMRNYMKKFAYGNTVTDQLWQEIGAATGQPVTDVAHDFTLQPGVPLVSAAPPECRDGASRTALTQSRFETDERSATPVAWRIPVRARALESGAEGSVIMPKSGASAIDAAGCGPVVINAGQAGYFRTLYAPEALGPLRSAFARIAEIDQLGILNDSAALGSAGLMPATAYLDFAWLAPLDSDPIVWRQLAGRLRELDRVFDGSPEQSAWRRLARDRLRPEFEVLGWTPRPDQGESAAILRERLIVSLGELDDAAVIAAARERFEREPSDPSALPAAIRDATLAVVARHADARTWEEMLARARKEPDPREKQRAYLRLGQPLDPALARRALELALSGEPPITVAPGIIDAVSDRHPDMAFSFALANEQAVLAKVEASSRWSYIPTLARTSSDLELARKLRDYAQSAIPEGARKDAEEVMAEIDRRARSYAHLRPQLESWVKAQ